jgi:iron complex transport system substrate-binding protein
MNRRQFLAATASLPLLLAACGDDDGEETAGGGGPWTFTDDRGEKVSLPKKPERFVMQEYAVAALWPYGIKPVGIFGSAPMDEQPLFADYDLSGIKSVGESWSEINLEAVAALRPDLIISTWWPGDGLGGMEEDKLAKKMEAIAPTVGVHATVPAMQTIEGFQRLAAGLGADVDSPEMKAARRRCDDAIEAFKAAVEARPGLRAMAVYADPEAFYVAKVEDYSDLLEYQAWGLGLVSGKSKDRYWEELSWENADKYPADLILYDNRAWSPKLEELEKIPLWRDLPAVEAGQLSPWHMEQAVSHELFAGHIEELTGAVEQARVLSV